jgi:primosomal protein N' (replication factor Y)
MSLGEESPGDFDVKDLEEVLDLEPVMPPDLLELASFVAKYYLAPSGEVVRALVPGDLPPWGNRRVSLTDAGAIAPPAGELEERVVEILLDERRMRVAELQRRIDDIDLPATLEAMRRRGRVSIEEPGRLGGRFIKAVELKAGELEELLERCGKAPMGRAVVEYLAALARPATVRELRAAVGCGAAVVKRLVDRGLLREFVQPERQSLARHRLGGEEPAAIVLRDDQAQTLAALERGLERAEFAPFLLRGMTGSGKTEVYLRAVETCLQQGRSAILLVPEIALVPALAGLVRERFGSHGAILHSNLSSAERVQEWERLRRGEARVVLGPRSALLAPLTDLGLVVVDEEHDTSYKQDATPRYNGRDLALWRAQHQGAVAVLVSATPSLESRYNVHRGKLEPLELTARVGSGRLPEGMLVDLRKEAGKRRPGEVVYSETLRRAMEQTLEAGDQIILLRNRRGYAPVLLCRACGEDFRCEDCGLPLTVHKRRRRLICHYCGEEHGVPSLCPECDEAALEAVGTGTERVEEQLRELLPGIAIDMLDADSRRRPGGAAAVLERFRAGETRILVGTQMVAKGHHFPRVALAGVLHADSYLGFPDFRAVERTYALLTQLAGRAGRGEKPGRVVIQTFQPSHYAIQAALHHDDRAYIEEEMRFRRTFHYPPFTRMIHLLGRHKDQAKAESEMRRLGQRLLAHPLAEGIRLSGPAPAPLERLRGFWRVQLLLRGPSGARLRRLVAEVLEDPVGLELMVDVDPYDLM